MNKNLNNTGYDRRQTRRTSQDAGTFYCWRNGRRLQLPVIEQSQDGARVVLPAELRNETELHSVTLDKGRKLLIEFRVAWQSSLLAGKTIAGLQTVLSTSRLAA